MSRPSYQRRCHDCGTASRYTSFPGSRKPHGQIDRCTDCAIEFEGLTRRIAEASPGFDPARPISTRDLYREAYRYRAGQTSDFPVPAR